MQRLTHLLLDRPDAAAGIALACLNGGRAVGIDKHAAPEDAPAIANAPNEMEEPNNKVRLKQIERDVIAWAAAGKSYADIATILALPYSTVRYHLDQARRRNGFHTVTQLIVHAACDFDMCPLEP